MIVENIDAMIEALTEARKQAVRFEEKNINAAGTKINKSFKEVTTAIKVCKARISEVRKEAKEAKLAAKEQA